MKIIVNELSFIIVNYRSLSFIMDRREIRATINDIKESLDLLEEGMARAHERMSKELDRKMKEMNEVMDCLRSLTRTNPPVKRCPSRRDYTTALQPVIVSSDDEDIVIGGPEEESL